MNQNEKSEAQLKNEEAVRKIMTERGYDKSPVKKKSNKSLSRLLILSVLTVVLLVSLIGLAIILINNNNDDKSKTSFNTDYYFEENEEKSENSGNNKEDEAQVQNEISAGNTLYDDYYQSSSSSNDIYEGDSIDTQSKQEYDDTRTPYDPHRCDDVRAKYDAVYNEINRLQAVWDEAYSNQDFKTTESTMKAKQEAIDSLDDIYWNEVVPCEKEMYGIE